MNIDAIETLLILADLPTPFTARTVYSSVVFWEPRQVYMTGRFNVQAHALIPAKISLHPRLAHARIHSHQICSRFLSLFMFDVPRNSTNPVEAV